MRKYTLIFTVSLLFLSVNQASAERVPLKANQLMYQTPTTASGRLQELKEENKKDIKELRAEYQTNLQAIKDARKKAIVTRLNTNISLVNQQATTSMAKGLEKIAALLARMSTQIQMLKAEGKDVTSASSAVTAAQTAIATAKAAITTQAANTYVLNISDESTLNTTVGGTVSQLRKDLQATYQTVKAARDAVVQVARALVLITKTTENSASSSATKL